MDIISIAVDGPAGAGKSTIAKLIAKKLSISYIDTGAMYRAMTYKVLESDINKDDYDEIKRILEDTEISIDQEHVYLDGVEVDKEIRDNEVSNKVSDIAKIKEVRDKMTSLQREISKEQSSILDGRDIGTVVLPDADYKFFITATPEERGRRRYEELKSNGAENITLNQIIDEIVRRDQIDSNREIAPLKRSKDAFLIDNTDLNIEESVDKIVDIIMEHRDVL